MGCGWRNFGKDWVHIDGGSYDHIDFNSITDLSQFESESVDLIYASHVIEYFDRFEIENVLKEWHRILKKQGVLRLAVPDFKALSTLYLDGKIKLDAALGPLYGRMDMGPQKIYHKTVYDFDSLKNVLEGLGFSNVKKYEWRETCHASFDDHSQAYIPHMNKESGTLISLNVECTK